MLNRGAQASALVERQREDQSKSPPLVEFKLTEVGYQMMLEHQADSSETSEAQLDRSGRMVEAMIRAGRPPEEASFAYAIEAIVKGLLEEQEAQAQESGSTEGPVVWALKQRTCRLGLEAAGNIQV